MESHMRAELVCQALIMAQRAKTLLKACCCTQTEANTPVRIPALLKKHKMVCSMSRKGNC